jgi:hypothetical protein
VRAILVRLRDDPKVTLVVATNHLALLRRIDVMAASGVQAEPAPAVDTKGRELGRCAAPGAPDEKKERQRYSAHGPYILIMIMAPERGRTRGRCGPWMSWARGRCVGGARARLGRAVVNVKARAKSLIAGVPTRG